MGASGCLIECSCDSPGYLEECVATGQVQEGQAKRRQPWHGLACGLAMTLQLDAGKVYWNLGWQTDSGIEKPGRPGQAGKGSLILWGIPLFFWEFFLFFACAFCCFCFLLAAWLCLTPFVFLSFAFCFLFSACCFVLLLVVAWRSGLLSACCWLRFALVFAFCTLLFSLLVAFGFALVFYFCWFCFFALAFCCFCFLLAA